MIRELTKSIVSFSWAMSLFGVEQVVNTLTPQSPGQATHKTTAAFQAVTQAIEGQLDGMMKGAFKTGDQLQRGLVDVMSSFLSLEALNPSHMMRMTSDMMRQTTEAMGRGFQDGSPGPQSQEGWGPMP